MRRASGKGRQALGAAVAVPVALAVLGVGAAAADTFTYTGAEQTYAVPAGITGLHVVLVGAAGASESVPDLSATGGHGARLTADVPVPAGTTTLYVEVGGNGAHASPPSIGSTATGGFNGGGNGPLGGSCQPIDGAVDQTYTSTAAVTLRQATGESTTAISFKLTLTTPTHRR